MFESLDLPLPFFLRDGKIEQIERFAAFFVCLSSMSSIAFPSGSSCYCRVVGWQAAPEKPFNKMYSTVLLPPVYNNNSPKKSSQIGRRVWMELL